MNEPMDPMPGELREMESALRRIVPTEPRRAGAADAAYEAGRRDGARAAQHVLRARLLVHRLATAASLVTAVALGAIAVTQNLGAGGQGPVASGGGTSSQAVSSPAQVLSPLSYMSLRSSVLDHDELTSDHLATPDGAALDGVGDGQRLPPAAGSLRAGQRGLDL